MQEPLFLAYVDFVFNTPKGAFSLGIPPNFIQSFTYEDVSNGAGALWTLELFDSTWGILDQLKDFWRSGPATYPMLLRWGVDDGFSVQWSDWRAVFLTSMLPGEVTRAGIEVVLEGFDSGTGNLAVMSNNVEMYWQNKKICDVAKEIATRNEWDYDVDDTGDVLPVISKDRGKTDLRFLVDLAGMARDKNGAAAYVVYIDNTTNKYEEEVESEGSASVGIVGGAEIPGFDIDNPEHVRRAKVTRIKPKLYFKQYANVIQAQNKSRHRFVVGTDRIGEVLSFSPSVNGHLFAAMGLSGMTYKRVDSDTFKVTDEKLTSTDHEVPTFASQARALITSDYINQFEIRDMDGAAVLAKMNSYYEKMRSAAFNATLEVIGHPYYKPFEVIDVDVITPRGDRFFTSGQYFVKKVTHYIRGDYRCVFELVRHGFEDRGPEVSNDVPKVEVRDQLAEVDQSLIEYENSAPLSVGGWQDIDKSDRLPERRDGGALKTGIMGGIQLGGG